MHRVYAYLIKQRFISLDIISHFAKQHTLYEDKEHHNTVFIGLEEKRLITRRNRVRINGGTSSNIYKLGVMFDWIGDAIDWISDEISGLWDNTVGSAVDAITDEIWNIMFEWLFNLIYGVIADLFEFINESTADVFSLAWVKSFITLFHHMGWILFVCGMIVAVFDCAIAYESGQNSIKTTCLNVLKGFMAANLVTIVPQRLYSLCVVLQGTFSYELLGGFIGVTSSSVADTGLSVIVALASDVSLFSRFS